METVLGGIIGLNGSQEPVKGLKGLIHSMFEEAREEVVQTYFDGVLKAIILKEPFDITKLTDEAIEAGLMALYSAGVMNTVTSCSIKIADDIIYWGPSQFNNYAEFSQFIENKIKDRQSLIDISPETAAKMGINRNL